MIDIRLPDISGTEAQQLAGIKRYLYQLAEQLNIALRSVETADNGGNSASVTNKTASKSSKEDETQASFNDIKGLIIKSAEIVNAYYEEISKKLEGVYVAESEFGTYKSETEQTIKETSDRSEQNFSNIQSILSDIEGIENSIIETNAHIYSGLLYYDNDGIPIYGLEIGQRNKVDGVEVFNKYARFTSDRLSFYDQNDNEVAYISDERLVITQVVVKGYFAQGEIEKVKDENGKETETFKGFKSTYIPGVGIVEKWEGEVGE